MDRNDELKSVLDMNFRRMFKDKGMTGFKVDDRWYIDFQRRDTLRNSYVELIRDRRFFTSERLGRFKTYKGFLNAIVLYISNF